MNAYGFTKQLNNLNWKKKEKKLVIHEEPKIAEISSQIIEILERAVNSPPYW